MKKQKNKEYFRTKEGLISKIYGRQKNGSEKRNIESPSYSKIELKQWLFSQKLFFELYNNYKNSGYSKELVPSCDRINDYKGYDLSNLKLMTWSENRKKGDSDRKNGINNKQSKAVIGINIKTGNKYKFYSAREAGRQTGINQENISNCCNLKRKTAGGFIFKYI